MDFEKFETTRVPLIKNGLSFLSGVGIGRIVGGATELVAPQSTRFGKIAVFVAKTGISATIAAAVDANTNKTIDEIVKAVKTVSQPAKAAD